MNPRYKNMVISVAILRGEPQGRSNPKVKDQCQMIPLRRTLAIHKALPVARPIPILEENRRSTRLPRVINLRNPERPNLPPSMVR
jgi:hypothetical protein